MGSKGGQGLAYYEVSYWEARFGSDPRESGPTGGFEWLSSGSELLDRTKALILAQPLRHLNILHIGVGTSKLSIQIMHFYRTHFAHDWPERCARIVNVDFSARSTQFQQRAERDAFAAASEPVDDNPLLMQYHTLNLLDKGSVQSKLGSGCNSEFDLVLDKSTTDSISTSPDVNLNDVGAANKGAIQGPSTQLLAMILASIAAPECTWLCHSYSSDRWQDLTHSRDLDLFPWEQKSRTSVELHKDSVHAPTLYHYVYEMQRKRVSQ